MALLLLLFSLGLLIFPLAGGLFGRNQGSKAVTVVGEAKMGVFDLRQMAESALPLDGEWLFYPGKVLSYDDTNFFSPDSAGTEWETINLPAELPGFTGKGTLALRLLLPNGEGLYGLKIPYFGSAWKLYINGKEVGGSGSIEPYIPRYQPREIIFSAPGDRLDLFFHIANEHHRRVRLRKIFFGSDSQIKELTHRQIIKDAIIFGSLLLLALYHLLLFITYSRETPFLHFGIIAILAALRAGVLSERILVRLWPAMPGELMMKAGFLPAFLLLPFFVYYLLRLTGMREPVPVARGLRIIIVFFTILIIAAPLKLYDAVFEYTLVPIALSGILSVSFISFKYRYGSKVGSILILAGGLIIFAAAINDYLREIGMIHTGEMVSAGILFFLLLQSFFLAWRLKHSQDDTIRLAREVETLNEDLELRIGKRTVELEEANQRLETLSRIDGLTGIPNRRYFDEVLLSEWKRSEREGRPLSLIMIDVDFFKDYNDNYGHPAGDICLKRIATTLQESLNRGEDFLARYGGEEFVVLLPGHPVDQAVKLAEKLRGKVEELAIVHAYSSAAPLVTISLGAAGKELLSEYAVEVLKKESDQALYTAKQNGRNRVERF